MGLTVEKKRKPFLTSSIVRSRSFATLPPASFCLFAAVLGACSADPGTPQEDVLDAEAAVVVGPDDRRDVFAHPDVALRQLAAESTVALMRSADLDLSNPNDVQIHAGQLTDLCTDEVFYGQTAAAFCSGTLIADDLVLTAAHCISRAGCSGVSMVFGFHQESPTELATITSDDVYSCAGIELWRLDDDGFSVPTDYAILRLDRSVGPNHTPAPMNTAATALPQGAPLIAITHPGGLPTKIDSGGVIVRHLPNWINMGASLDIMGGSSGGGVFDAQHELMGVLTHASGVDNFTFDEDANCRRWNSTPDNEDHAGVRYAFFAIREFCESNDHELCGADDPVCGDAVCEPRESIASCAQDCPWLPDLNPASVNAVLTILSRWNQGYCAMIDVTNLTQQFTSWELGLNLTDSSVSQSWSATFQSSGSEVTITPPPWAPAIPPNGTANLGFCASSFGPSADVELVSVR